MISDFRHYDSEQPLRADVCIVGAGATGIATAVALSKTNFTIIMIEGGGYSYSAESRSLYQCSVSGLRYAFDEGRARVLGGTTTLWGGQASPFLPLDFEARQWVSHSGWPLTLDHLQPYFPRVDDFMGIPHSSHDERTWVGPPPPFLDPESFHFIYSQFSAQPNLANKYGSFLKTSGRLQVFVNANATYFDVNPSGSRVASLNVATLEGKSARIQARYFVMCCGAIENARLLLCSNQTVSAGLGNEGDWVGRCFQDHLHMRAAPIVPTSRDRFTQHFGTLIRSGVKMCPKIVTSRRFQEKHQILHVACDVTTRPDERSPLKSAQVLVNAVRKPVARSQLVKASLGAVKGSGELARILWSRVVQGRVTFPSRSELYLGIQCETEPNPNSRIRLSQDRDRLGFQKADIDWRLTGLEARTIDIFVRSIDEEFRRLGLAKLDLGQFFVPGDPSRLDEVAGGGHHPMGTTRMSQSPGDGVVNTDCRVHGIDNLYVGSTSVFPTGSFSNPTYNAMACCFRLADHLAKDSR
ncbi:MAG: GMC family oxidoreductase [Vicinamibacterales bacterium]